MSRRLLGRQSVDGEGFLKFAEGRFVSNSSLMIHKYLGFVFLCLDCVGWIWFLMIPINLWFISTQRNIIYVSHLRYFDRMSIFPVLQSGCQLWNQWVYQVNRKNLEFHMYRKIESFCIHGWARRSACFLTIVCCSRCFDYNLIGTIFSLLHQIMFIMNWGASAQSRWLDPLPGGAMGLGDDNCISNRVRRAKGFYKIAMRVNKTLVEEFHTTKPISLKL